MCVFCLPACLSVCLTVSGTHQLIQQPPGFLQQEVDEADVVLVGGQVHVLDHEEGRCLDG